MLDDEVEYIGSRIAQRASSVSDSMTHHRPVTGITLHVEKSGSVAAYDLLFHKAESSVVQIGRRPGTDNDKHDSEKAMFRCPVVSRRHAKITFTHAGSVYLFDLGSHHGTHVRKPEETISVPLLPESPHLLSDGEIVTLGKTVGKGDELVRPVVFRVEIQYAQPNPPAQLIDLTRSASSERQESPPAAKPSLPKPFGRRYGLNDSSASSASSSSDEMSSSYMNDNSSDIEEVSSSSSSEINRASLPHASHTPSHIGHAIEVLKSLIPPLHPPSIPPQRSQSTTDIQLPLFVFPPIHVPACNSFSHHLRLPLSPPFTLPPLSMALSEKTPEIPAWSEIYADGPSEGASNESRATSPMDLASPSSVLESEKHTTLKSIVCDWSRSRVASPDPSISSLYVECGFNPGTTAISGVVEEGPAPVETEKEPAAITVPNESAKRTSDEQGPTSNPSSVDVRERLDSLSNSFDALKADVAKLQICQDGIEHRIDAGIHEVAGKLADLEQHVASMDVVLTRLEAVSDIHGSEMQETQSQLSKMQLDLEAVMDTDPAPEAQRQGRNLDERKDVKESIEALRQLVSEMQTLRDNAQQQMTVELGLVRAARETTVASINGMSASPARSQSPTALKSLKRKRDDGDDESQEAGEGQIGRAQSVLFDETMKFVDEVMEYPTHTVTKAVGEDDTPDSTIGPDACGVIVPMRKRKRARRAATTMVRTVTAIALGAVATWSALAYT